MATIAAYEVVHTRNLAAAFVEAVHSREVVNGLTHTFHRYPARLSPLFARAAIEMFTRPSEAVLNPFMSGGTALVEACSLGRRAVGTDVSSLVTFTAKVKRRLYLRTILRGSTIRLADLRRGSIFAILL